MKAEGGRIASLEDHFVRGERRDFLSFRLVRNLSSKQPPLSPFPKGESEGFRTSRNDRPTTRLEFYTLIAIRYINASTKAQALNSKQNLVKAITYEILKPVRDDNHRTDNNITLGIDRGRMPRLFSFDCAEGTQAKACGYLLTVS